MSTYMAKKETVERKWYIIDAAGKPLGKTAAAAATILRGKHRPEYTPHVDCGEFVVIINASKAVLTGKKLEQKFYRRHSGYIGGLKEVSYKHIMACLQIEFSWASNIEREERFVELRGTKGGFKWVDTGEARVFSEENGKLTDNVRRCEMGNGHDEALKHFTAIVLDGAEKDYVPVQGVNMIKILEAMYKSAETGKEVIL